MVIYDEEHNRLIAPKGAFITNDDKEFVLVHYLSNSDKVNDWWDITEEEYAERSKVDELLSVSD